MNKRRPTQEELDLWRQVAAGIKPMKARRSKTGASRTIDKSTEPEQPPAPKHPPKQPPKPKGPSPRIAPKPAPKPKETELTHGLSHGIDRRQAERFRKGKLQIEGKIDLHGRTQAQAHDDLFAFLRRGQNAGKRCVLVITGKGMTTTKEGVLRQMVPRWLNEPGFRHLVLAFDYAQPQHGGEGALYVLLKRAKDKAS